MGESAVLAPPVTASEDPVSRQRLDDDRTARGAEAAVYRLAGDTELLGAFQDSGYEVPKYLLSRGDGQVMQLPELLYRVAASLDGRSAGEIATRLSAELSMDLTAEDVSFLVTERLRPVGVIAPDEREQPEAGRGTDDRGNAAGGASPTPPMKSDPLLGLRYRVGVIPAGTVGQIAGIFRPLFARPVWVAALAAFIGLDVVILMQGSLIDQATAGLLQLIHQPVLVLVILGLGVVSGAFHECGHVTACRYGGATPGDMGVGLYIVWPAYYSTVTDSYRLNRVGRLRTDLGGVYFDAIFLVGLSGLYLATGEPWLLAAILVMHVDIAYQFFPSIRFDGYYILSDLVGVPDLFAYVGPVLTSLVPGRSTHPKVRELRPWARRVIVLWVAVSVPVILIGLTIFLVAAPAVLPVLWQALLEYLQTIDSAVRSGDVVTTSLHVLQLFFLVLPWLGSALITWMVLQLLYRLIVRRWDRLRIPAAAMARVRGCLALATVGGLAVALVARVVSVAGSLPASEGEKRLVDAALAAVEGVSTGPSVGPAEFVAREQLVWYAQLTGAFERHASVVTAGRELAVVTTVVVVLCLAALAFTRQLRPRAIALSLAGAVIMGPVVTVLATLGPGVLGAAWIALGALLLTGVAGRAAAGFGGLAVGVGVLTAPVTAVPLALGAAVLLAGRRSPARHAPSGPRHARPGEDAPGVRRWLLVALALPVAGLTAYLGTYPGDLPVDGPVRAVVVAPALVVVVAGLRHSSIRVPATVAAAALVLAVLPWPGAGSVLAGVVAAVLLLGALLIHESRNKPPTERSHPLVRAAGAVPMVVLVVVGALFLPSTAPRLPTADLAAWITGPSSQGGTVAVPTSLWGDLVRDGVPPERLVRAGLDTTADWTVGTGEPSPGATAVAHFGREPVLTVSTSAPVPGPAPVPTPAHVPDGTADALLPTLQAPGEELAAAPGLTAPPDVLAALREGTVDLRALAVLGALTSIHAVTLGIPPPSGTPDADGAPIRRFLITHLDGQPTARRDVVTTLTQWLTARPGAIGPSKVSPGPSGVLLEWLEPSPIPGA